MNETANQPRERWYKNSKFSLLPIFKVKKGNEWNSKGFMINWLWFLITDSMTPSLNFNIELSSHSLIGFRIGIPYINIFFSLFPLPNFISRIVHEWTWRVGERSKFNWMK